MITIVVRGGKVFKIPLSANFVYPEIEVLGQEMLDFGRIPIMKYLNQK